jgi:hypothetical protein
MKLTRPSSILPSCPDTVSVVVVVVGGVVTTGEVIQGPPLFAFIGVVTSLRSYLKQIKSVGGGGEEKEVERRTGTSAIGTLHGPFNARVINVHQTLHVH